MILVFLLFYFFLKMKKEAAEGNFSNISKSRDFSEVQIINTLYLISLRTIFFLFDKNKKLKQIKRKFLHEKK